MPGLAMTAMVESTVFRAGETTTARRYYLSPVQMEPAVFAAIVRSHWRSRVCRGCTRKGVHHELTPCAQAARKMRVGPSGSAFRGGSQTTPGGCG